MHHPECPDSIAWLSRESSSGERHRAVLAQQPQESQEQGLGCAG